MPDGERAKTLAQLEKLARADGARGADRHSVLLALGGGVVGDVGGFLASIFMRGIPVVQIPTTLLAQVDSAIGGKTGVNLKAGKNLLGTFHQPLAVLVDPGRAGDAAGARISLGTVRGDEVWRDSQSGDLRPDGANIAKRC